MLIWSVSMSREGKREKRGKVGVGRASDDHLQTSVPSLRWAVLLIAWVAPTGAIWRLFSLTHALEPYEEEEELERERRVGKGSALDLLRLLEGVLLFEPSENRTVIRRHLQKYKRIGSPDKTLPRSSPKVNGARRASKAESSSWSSGRGHLQGEG